MYVLDRAREMFPSAGPAVAQLKFLSLCYLGTHLDPCLVVVIDRAGHHVGPGVGLGPAQDLLGVLADGGEGRAGGPEDGEVSGLLGVEGGGGVEEGVLGREEWRGPELCRPPQLVDVILELLQLLQVC